MTCDNGPGFGDPLLKERQQQQEQQEQINHPVHWSKVNAMVCRLCLFQPVRRVAAVRSTGRRQFSVAVSLAVLVLGRSFTIMDAAL